MGSMVYEKCATNLDNDYMEASLYKPHCPVFHTEASSYSHNVCTIMFVNMCAKKDIA